MNTKIHSRNKIPEAQLFTYCLIDIKRKTLLYCVPSSSASLEDDLSRFSFVIHNILYCLMPHTRCETVSIHKNHNLFVIPKWWVFFFWVRGKRVTRNNEECPIRTRGANIVSHHDVRQTLQNQRSGVELQHEEIHCVINVHKMGTTPDPIDLLAGGPH